MTNTGRIRWVIDEGGWMHEQVENQILSDCTCEWENNDAYSLVARLTPGCPMHDHNKEMTTVTSDVTQYDPTEQDVLSTVFTDMLRGVTRDGGNKRARGEKPGWYVDPSHEAAIYSHLNKWKHGETHDPDSGAHPLVHLAWRALAIAYQETYGRRDPAGYWGVHNG